MIFKPLQFLLDATHVITRAEICVSEVVQMSAFPVSILLTVCARVITYPLASRGPFHVFPFVLVKCCLWIHTLGHCPLNARIMWSNLQLNVYFYSLFKLSYCFLSEVIYHFHLFLNLLKCHGRVILGKQSPCIHFDCLK